MSKSLLVKFLGDRKARVGMIANGSSTLGSALCGLMIPIFLSPIQQGILYTLRNLILICSYAELGAGAVLMRQVAGQEGYSDLVMREKERGAYLRLALGLCLVIVLGTLTAMAFGTLIYLRELVELRGYANWDAIWILSGIPAAFALGLAIIEQFFFGCNRETIVYYGKISRNVLASVAFILALVMGMGVWSLPLQLWVSFLVLFCVLLVQHGKAFKNYLSVETTLANVRHRIMDLWPKQWRYSVSLVTGAVLFYSPIPILAGICGLAEAGKWGFCYSTASALVGLSGVMISSQEPRWCALVAGGKEKDLISEVSSTFKRAMRVALLGTVGIPIIWIILDYYVSDIATKTMPLIWWLFMYLVLAIVSVGNATMVTFIRAFLSEPFARIAWLSTGLGLVVMPLGAYTNGANGCLLGFAIAHFVASFGILKIFRLRYAEIQRV